MQEKENESNFIKTIKFTILNDLKKRKYQISIILSKASTLDSRYYKNITILFIKVKSGVPPNVIIDQLRDDFDYNVKKKNRVTRKDLSNISSKFGLHHKY